MKRFIGFLVIYAFILAGTAVANGDVPEENFYPTVKQEVGWMGFNSDNSIEYTQPSSLYGMTSMRQNDFVEKMYFCDSLESINCTKSEIKAISFASLFTKCIDEIDLDCIDSFEIKNEDGRVSQGEFERNWVPGPVFKGDKAKKVPTGYGPSSWKVRNGNGEIETYALSVGVNGYIDFQRNPNNSNFESFFAAIQPIKVLRGAEFVAPVAKIMTRGAGASPGWNTSYVEKGCQIAEEGVCGYRLPFDLNKTVVLKVRLSQPVQGWLHGRLNDANIVMKPGAENSQIVEISAKPLSIPSIFGWVKWGELPQKLKDLYPVGAGGTSRVLEDFTTTDLATRTLLAKSSVSGDHAITEMNLWLPLLNDKAAAMRTFWIAQTIRGELPFESQSCVTGKGFTGVIGTNAAVYSDGPPRFDPVEQSLNYTVGASHFDSKGELFKGYYQLNLRSDVARCLYGFGTAPIQAKIEVSSSDGTPSVATTVITESDGWLKMTASGFTFSTPKIKVRLSQEKAIESLAASKKPSKETTITCSKGKKVQRIYGVKPKCPAGYKKR